MLFDVCCLLVCLLLFVVGCELFVVCGLLRGVCCIVRVVCCLLFGLRCFGCWVSFVCYLRCVVRGVLFVVCFTLSFRV